MPKIMPKFDAENDLKSAILDANSISLVDAGRASLRRRRLRHPGFFYLKCLTLAGVGGFSDPWKI